MKGTIDLLSTEEITEIHHASLEILETVGMEIQDDEIRQLLHFHGARLEDSRVYFPRELVEWAIDHSQKEHIMYARNPDKTVYPARSDVTLLTNSIFCTHIYDWKLHRKRPSTIADSIEFTRISNFYDEIAFYAATLLPMDCPANLSELYALYNALYYSDKHCHCYFSSPESARYAVSLAEAVAGGEEALRRRPLFTANLPALTGLSLSRKECATIGIFAKHGIPILTFCSLMACITAPQSIAGTLALSNAAILGVLTMIKVINPKATLLYATDTCTPSPYNNSVDYDAPEYVLFSSGNRQLADHYGLVSATAHDCSEVEPSSFPVVQGYRLRQLRNLMVRSNTCFCAGGYDFSLFASQLDLILAYEIYSDLKPVQVDTPLFSQGAGADRVAAYLDHGLSDVTRRACFSVKKNYYTFMQQDYRTFINDKINWILSQPPDIPSPEIQARMDAVMDTAREALAKGGSLG
ncbi:MAG: trimethylamine methyltransferase family protein [Eubacterium sp.]